MCVVLAIEVNRNIHKMCRCCTEIACFYVDSCRASVYISRLFHDADDRMLISVAPIGLE